MLIIKRYIGEIVNVQGVANAYDITVLAIDCGQVTLDVAGGLQCGFEGDQVHVPVDGSGPLLVVIDRVGERWARLGFQGDPSRRIERCRHHHAEAA